MLNRFLLLLVLLAAPAAQAKAETAEIALPVVPLSILAADGTLHEFRVELGSCPTSESALDFSPPYFSDFQRDDFSGKSSVHNQCFLQH